MSARDRKDEVRTATRSLPTRRDAPAPDEAPDLDRGLGELLDDDRRQRAIEDRRQGESRRYVDRDVATWKGLLLDLAENDQTVVLEHLGGRIAGRITSLGEDVIVLEGRGAGLRSIIRLHHLVGVTAGPATSTPDARGHRDRPTDLRFRDLLAEAADQMRAVAVHVVGRDKVLGGLLRAVGEDVLTVAPDRAATTCTFLALEHVTRVDLEP